MFNSQLWHFLALGPGADSLCVPVSSSVWWGCTLPCLLELLRGFWVNPHESPWMASDPSDLQNIFDSSVSYICFEQKLSCPWWFSGDSGSQVGLTEKLFGYKYQNLHLKNGSGFKKCFINQKWNSKSPKHESEQKLIKWVPEGHKLRCFLPWFVITFLRSTFSHPHLPVKEPNHQVALKRLLTSYILF